MNQQLVDRVVNAVLYEGYILYPYRPSVKNRQRWTFGGLCPESFSRAQGGTETWKMQTQCLVRGGPATRLSVTVRFLHLQARLVGRFTVPLSDWPKEEEPAFEVVESLTVGDQLWHTWQEAVEREIAPVEAELGYLAARPRDLNFAFPTHRQLEPLRAPGGDIPGILVRAQEAVNGAVEVTGRPAGEGLYQVTVQVNNRTRLEDAGLKTRDEALLRSLVSTHAILGVRGGAFVSLLDPPEPFQEAAASCRNEGVWPVLVGEAGETDTMLASPIILYDHPQVAPESPGDLFDATEIDEILTLRILTLTDDEKRAMAAVDRQARALLEQTEALTGEDLMRLHGTFRGLRPVPAEGEHG
jgi:hydrogenase maturation protease